jgi:hypothetical protein
MDLDLRIKYVHEKLLTRLWYTAQVFPIQPEYTRQLNTAISWFLWRGAIFRVPLSTLQKNKEEGGWDLVNLDAKSKTLYVRRLREQGQSRKTLTADWLDRWRIRHEVPNPPNPGSIPTSQLYLRVYIREAAYVPTQKSQESNDMYKKRTYQTLKTIDEVARNITEMRIYKLNPKTEWRRVWTNLQSTPGNNSEKMQWYKIIHDIIPTNERLHRIGLASTDLCAACGQTDTLEHRLTTCGEAPVMWNWTRRKIAEIMRTADKY